ncbi:PcfJ domain-containing protein [Bosea sp. ANAM02]|uniref:PcfJ domain-containing protein n=1 Tax=Bosea sp. ANAM02 TaxID=2020412 RepID=UPI00140EE63C|nr:PcfJ domain-containing protein [Bosea sp. ANAM02]BCB22076.1 hypothetical protein OCUBac02_49700 [Bosea sp. ANAM02]
MLLYPVMLDNHQDDRLKDLAQALAEIGVSAGLEEGKDGRIGFWVVYPASEGKYRFLMAAANDDGLIDVMQVDAPSVPGHFAVTTLAAMPTSLVSADEEIYHLRALGVLPDHMRPSGDVSVGIGIALCKRFYGDVIEQDERFELIRRVANWLDDHGLARLRDLIGADRIALCETAVRLGGGWHDSGRHGLRGLRWPSDSVGDVRVAIEAYPALASIIFWSPALPGTPKAVAMETLAEFDIALDKRQGLLRRLAGVDLPPLGISALHAAADLPLGWVPTRHDTVGWHRFSGALSLFRHLKDAFGTPPHISAGGYGGRWDELESKVYLLSGRLLTAPGLLPGSAMASELVEFVRNQTHDVTFDFCETIIVPLMASLGHDEVAASRAGFLTAIGGFLFGDRSLVAVMEVAKRWHDRGVQIPTRFNTSRTWEAWLPDFSIYDRLSIKQLTTSCELIDEGRIGPDEGGLEGLAHCVGGYAPRASRGDCAILSIRTDGARLSTAELRWKDGQFQVLQHYGKGNTPPPIEAESALKRYLRCFADGILAVDLEALARVRARARSDATAVCGYDWREAGAIERVLDLWRPYLAKNRQGITLDELADLFCLSPSTGMMMR